MKRVYFSPVTDIHPVQTARFLCAIDGTATPFGVDNTEIDDMEIS